MTESRVEFNATRPLLVYCWAASAVEADALEMELAASDYTGGREATAKA